MDLNFPRRHSSFRVNTQRAIFESTPSPKTANLDEKPTYDGPVMPQFSETSSYERFSCPKKHSRQAIDSLVTQGDDDRPFVTKEILSSVYTDQDPFLFNASYSASESLFQISNSNLDRDIQLNLGFGNDFEHDQRQMQNSIRIQKPMSTRTDRPESSGHQTNLSLDYNFTRQKRAVARYNTRDCLDLPKNASDVPHQFDRESVEQKSMESACLPDFPSQHPYFTPQRFTSLPRLAPQSEALYPEPNFQQHEIVHRVKHEENSDDGVRLSLLQDKTLLGMEARCNNSFSASSTSSFVGSINHVRDQDQVVEVADLAEHKLPKTVRFAS